MYISKRERVVMKKIFLAAFLVVAFLIRNSLIANQTTNTAPAEPQEYKVYKEIKGNIKKGETLFDIFKKNRLNINELFQIKEAAADTHRLRELRPGQPYKITIDDKKQINSLTYWINSDSFLNITRNESGFCAEKTEVEYEKRILDIGGKIKNNLISSIGDGRENLTLAFQLSDIYAWDIDFNTDLRNGDVFKIVVEGLYSGGKFKKYGNILAAEFINNGARFHAYRFEADGKTGYYDDKGKSLRRSFLKAPLSFKRISSGFSRRRFHPILKIYRPHLGVDYAAPGGTPVSAVGDGKVIFSGYRGQYGNTVIISHFNGYRTYYGHLSKIAKNVKRGSKVTQSQVIGYVGATGLATGPHLDYRVSINSRFVNPVTLKLPSGRSVPVSLTADFKSFRNQLDIRIASITPLFFASVDKNSDNKHI
jgi:murein DD-endopeptidase MepM/ murein hydrolase activator NlpD